MEDRDAERWLQMREALWPGDEDDHRAAIARYFAGHRHEPKHVLIALDGNGEGIGFAELSIHNIVDGCETDHVGYLEGWYVGPQARRQGVGGALIAAAEAWARGEGCTEFASDALIENEPSLAAHRALGFTETARVCTLMKRL